MSGAAGYWYKNAVIYQLHVRAFKDSEGDGIGDFAGLIEKLDYLQWLGVSAIWILPFYPSPLRDDGYDVSDYRRINPSYGNMRQFRAFVREAHNRGLRVITELIVNHTSDQHPWFQRARLAKPGSNARNYYVWSDDDKKYAGTRIIFTDTETSNWTWDPVAKSYYWHRFFSHQPDLNFANPHVIEEVRSVMRYWFDMGVDGMRLDAIPYLCEREGTSNENLPETHEVIKNLRRTVEEEYPDRILLAEANQWPEDIQDYFGDSDECQMAFHFPLMPRLFLSLATQDRFPIYDIMQQTPAIPESCQWAIFLRNHDEMTLEMVTDRERAFMYEVYAPEHRARINVGIRRRLAPLLGNDRRKIELMISLLLSMPGTPIMYYGDEIGMGDNIFLNDRDGVRTPMQWSPDRNGGFSTADTQRLFLPPIQDSIYGFEAINVEAQMRNTSSLLNWHRRLISVRQSHKVFGEGKITFLYPENRHIIAYLREYQDETVLCVANLAESAQAVGLDLARFAGRTPIEMVGWSQFPRISEQRYAVTLPAHAFFWFLLRNDQVSAETSLAELPELTTLVLPRGWRSLSSPAVCAQLEKNVLPSYLQTQKWYSNDAKPVSSAHVLDVIPLTEDDSPLLLVLEGDNAGGHPASLLLVDRSVDFTVSTMPPSAFAIARGRTGPREFLVYDASTMDRPWIALSRTLLSKGEFRGRTGGRLRFETDDARLANLNVNVDDSVRCIANDRGVSAIIDGTVYVKLYRNIEPGLHTEYRYAEALRCAGFENAPALVGAITYEADGNAPVSVGIAYRFVGHRGTGREIAIGLLRQRMERGRLNPTPSATGHRDDDGFGGFMRYAKRIGERVAEFHAALLSQGEHDEFFAAERYEAADIDWEIRLGQGGRLAALDRAQQARAQMLLRELGGELDGEIRSRIHGDLSLYEILVANDDVMIVGIDGNSVHPADVRDRKRSPLYDLACLSMSFDLIAEEIAEHIGSDPTESGEHLRPLIGKLAHRAREALYSGYETGIGHGVSRRVLRFFRLQVLLKNYVAGSSEREPAADTTARLLAEILFEETTLVAHE